MQGSRDRKSGIFEFLMFERSIFELFYGNNVINESLQCYNQLSEIQNQLDAKKPTENSQKLLNFIKILTKNVELALFLSNQIISL